MLNPMIIGAIGTGISVVTAGACTGITMHKAKKMDQAMENMLEKISNTVTIDVADDYIHQIVEKAVERETSARITTEAQAAVTAIKSDMSKKIQKEVNKAYSDLKASVKKQMEEEVGKIDLDDIRREIIDEGREAAAKQFKKDLDKIVELQNENLKNVNDIYANIADTLKGSKGTTLTIS